MFAHVNVAAARHVPERHQVRGRDHRDGARPACTPTRSPGSEPAGLVTTGGTGSILHALLAYREHVRRTSGASPGPTSSSPRPGTRRSTRAATCFGIELRTAPVDPETTTVDARRRWPTLIDDRHDRDRRLGLQLRLRHHRPDRRARRAGARARRRPARRRLPRRLHPAVRRGARVRHPAVRLPGPRRHQHLRRHPQVRLRVQGQLDAAVPRQGAAQRAVLLPHRLDRRQVLLAGHRGLPLGRAAGGDLGGDGAARPGGLPAATPGRSSSTADAMKAVVRTHPELRIMGEPDVLLQLHLRRVRHLPRRRLHAGARLAVQRPAVPQRDPHGGHPAADPAGRRRRVRRRPRRGRRLRPGASRPPGRPRSPARSTAGSPAG